MGMEGSSKSSSSSWLPCVFVYGILCSFRKSSHVGIMNRCFECPHWKEFESGMDEDDSARLSEIPDYSVSHLSKAQIEGQLRGFRNRLLFNAELWVNAYWFLPVNSFGHANYSPVGRGPRTSDGCGGFRLCHACKNVAGHKGGRVGSRDSTGKCVLVLSHSWCHKSTCCVCFVRGWSVKVAGDVCDRLETAVERGLGKIEHITVSPAREDIDLSEDKLRVLCRNALLDRGVEGERCCFMGIGLIS